MVYDYRVTALEEHLRESIIAAVMDRASRNGGVITRAELSALALPTGDVGRVVDTTRGIRNPAGMDATISVISDSEGRYSDRPAPGGFYHYSYELATSDGRVLGSNAKLRVAFERGLPILFLRKLGPNVFVPFGPVFVVDDRPERKEFLLALDESVRFMSRDLPEDSPQRRYAERVVRSRLHQAEFRGRVLPAYLRRCAICRLQHVELLDAAHIIADGEDGGEPVVVNGIALCKIHHAAFDQMFLGIDAEYRVHINQELLLEVDGPMLRHGLQEMHHTMLSTPERKRDRPDRERLAERFRRFLDAG